MRINEFFDSSYMQGITDTPVFESVGQLIKMLGNEIDDTRAQALSAGGKEGTKTIEQFLESRIKTYVSLRTLLALDTKVQRGEFDGDSYDNYNKLVGSFYHVLVSGTVEAVIDVFARFYDKHNSPRSKFQATLKGFEKDLVSALRLHDKDTGITGMEVLDMMKKHLQLVEQQAAAYRKEHNPIKPKEEFAESVAVLFDTLALLESKGLLDILLESDDKSPKEKEVKAYYSIVKGKLYVDDKHHRNVKSVVVGRGVDAPSASKDMKPSIKRSVSEINKALKKEGAKLVVEVDDISVLSFDELKKKNIDNLVGARVVSRGFMLLDGATAHGNLGKEVQYAPLGHTFLNKSSVTRYLNKDR